MHMHGLLDNVFIMSQQTLIMSPFPLTWVELMKLKIDRFDDKIGICVFKTNLKVSHHQRLPPPSKTELL